ncbi:MAG: hypothetical protein J6V74_03945 [Bacteroidales bacterium]|jgi:hypothetical protein|nr:hypothetical protein [Bacteroidales bacterium]
MEKITRYIIVFFILEVLQIFVFNNVSAIGQIAPYLYVGFILILPVTMSPTIVLLLAFLSGFMIDLSINTLGVHASATVMMAFARPTVLKLLAPRIGYESNNTPILKYFGLPWVLKYTSVCVTIHHIMLYFCFTLTFEDAGFMLIRMLINVFLTVLVIIITEYFVIKR